MTPKASTSLAAIQQIVREFRDAREWQQFHSPKNLSMSIAIEAAELMEHFQWLSTDEAAALPQTDPTARQAIAEELADVFIYCFSLADRLEFDVGEIIFDKMAKNAAKYPARREA